MFPEVRKGQVIIRPVTVIFLIRHFYNNYSIDVDTNLAIRSRVFINKL